MVAPAVFHGARLAADGVSGLDGRACAFLYASSHSFDDRSVGFRQHLGVVAHLITAFGILMDMGQIIVAAVGYRGRQVAELQRSDRDIALSHSSPPDGLAVPSFFVAAVQIIGICQQPAFLACDIHAHRPAQSHASHIVAPGIDGLVAVFIHEVVVNHRCEIHQEPRVARECYGVSQVQRRAVVMASHADVAVGDAVVAFHGGLGGHDSL